MNSPLETEDRRRRLRNGPADNRVGTR